MNRKEAKEIAFEILIWIAAFAFAGALFLSAMFGVGYLVRTYDVWSKGMQGKAKLAEAEWSRQISVEEARATKDAAALLSEAEIERAKGVAQANKIIGDSLKDNESYLRYLWINGLHLEQNNVIYVPTEANLPILEAGKR